MLQKKDMLELKKRLTKDDCTISRIIGYYVTEDADGKKSVSSQFSKNFLSLEDSEFFKYLEIVKQIYSGKVGDSLMVSSFYDKEVQSALYSLSSSSLRQDGILESFRDSIIDSYNHVGNYLILFFSDNYDVPDKGEDGYKTGESSSVYEHIVCAICPVDLSKPGLGCISDDKEIGVLHGDWVVNKVEVGFLYPAFIDRCEDRDFIIIYNKNTKDPHTEFASDVLKCAVGMNATEKRNILTDALSDVVSESEIDMVYTGIQAAIYEKVEEDEEFELSKKNITHILSTGYIEDEDINGVSEKLYEALKEENIDECPAITVLDKNVAQKAERKLQSDLELINIKVSQAISGNVKMLEENGCKYVQIPVENNEVVRVNGKIL